MDNAFTCSKCGKIHNGLPALAFSWPDYYGYLPDDIKENIAELSEDFCIIRHPEQTDRFIRTTMTFPLTDSCDALEYGIWVSVSEQTFEEYRAEFYNNIAGKTYFGRICNEIPGYRESTLGLPVQVETKADGIRPEIFPHDGEHELILDWEQGISLAEAQRRVEGIEN